MRGVCVTRLAGPVYLPFFRFVLRASEVAHRSGLGVVCATRIQRGHSTPIENPISLAPLALGFRASRLRRAVVCSLVFIPPSSSPDNGQLLSSPLSHRSSCPRPPPPIPPLPHTCACEVSLPRTHAQQTTRHHLPSSLISGIQSLNLRSRLVFHHHLPITWGCPGRGQRAPPCQTGRHESHPKPRRTGRLHPRRN